MHSGWLYVNIEISLDPLFLLPDKKIQRGDGAGIIYLKLAFFVLHIYACFGVPFP